MGLQSRAVVGLVLVACSRAMDTGLSRHVEASSGHVEASSRHVEASSGPMALTQRDLELVLGAERAMEAGPGTITVTDTELGHCVLAVRDTGGGAAGEDGEGGKYFWFNQIFLQADARCARCGGVSHARTSAR